MAGYAALAIPLTALSPAKPRPRRPMRCGAPTVDSQRRIVTIYQCAATFLGLDVAVNPGQVHGVVNSRGDCVDRRGYLRQALLLLLVLTFLLETWIWDRVVAVLQRVSRAHSVGRRFAPC